MWDEFLVLNQEKRPFWRSRAIIFKISIILIWCFLCKMHWLQKHHSRHLRLCWLVYCFLRRKSSKSSISKTSQTSLCLTHGIMRLLPLTKVVTLSANRSELRNIIDKPLNHFLTVICDLDDKFLFLRQFFRCWWSWNQSFLIDSFRFAWFLCDKDSLN